VVDIAVLVSGGGSNLQALIDKPGGFACGRLRFVLSSNPSAFALRRAEAAGLETAVCCPRDYPGPDAYTEALVGHLRGRGIGVVALAGFMHILAPCFFGAYAGRAVNIHPSLLPAFGGKGFYGLRVHEAVLERGVKLTGATAHIVTEEPDAGPILLQKAVEVLPGDTPQSLQKRVMELCEWELLPRAVDMLCERLAGEPL
jgi:phosphoribosylglycinamide formyltransferase-1